MESDEFEWDDGKAEANLRKHKISFRVAKSCFDDPFAVIEQDTARTTVRTAFWPRAVSKVCS